MGTKINDDANVAVIGSSGAIGAACVRQLAGRVTAGKIYAFSRSVANFNLSNVIEAHIDVEHESSIDFIIEPSHIRQASIRTSLVFKRHKNAFSFKPSHS